MNKSKIFSRLRGFIGAFALFFSAFFGTLSFLLPALPFAFIPGLHTAFRYYTDFFVTAWLTFAIAIMRIFHGVNIVTHGDSVASQDKALIIMNHRTRLDWFYLWAPAITDSFLYDLKIALKRTLAKIPGAGWACQFACFLFLDRRADVDLPRISSYLMYLASFRTRNFKLMVFPEGTDFCKSSRTRSDDFADKNGLPRYEFVIHPRTTGVEFAFNTLMEMNALDAVYDVTIAYDGPFPQTESALLTGELPKCVHFFVMRYSAKEIAESDGPAEFCRKVWAQKENFLKSFYDGNGLVKEKTNTRSEGAFALFLEWTALIFWTCYLIIVFFAILPCYWHFILILAIGMFAWSEHTTKSIDGTIIQAGSKHL